MRKLYLFAEKTGSFNPHCVGAALTEVIYQVRGFEHLKKERNGMVGCGLRLYIPAHLSEKGPDSPRLMQTAGSLAVPVKFCSLLHCSEVNAFDIEKMYSGRCCGPQR